MSDVTTDPAAVYDDLKFRLKRLGLNLQGAAAHMGISHTTTSRWRTTTTPLYALAFLRLFETYFVLPATVKDADDAMRTPLQAVVDDAIAKGWTRPQIAEMLRKISDETDRSRKS